MIWINFLHFYQPANIGQSELEEALDKSYYRLLQLLENHPDFKLTANFSGCLLERLAATGHEDFLERLKTLVVSGQVELVGSAAYHGLLPLLPPEETVRQIGENEAILKRFLGVSRPDGFFLPEMAYSPAVAKLIKEAGYRWLILDEAAASGSGLDPEKIYKDEASGLEIVFRNRQLSNSFPPDRLISLIGTGSENGGGMPVAITATDAELYGLRHEDPTGEMEKIAASPEIRTMAVSSWIREKQGQEPEILRLSDSSWESGPDDVAAGRPFFLWEDRKNPIQKKLWELARLALSLDGRYRMDANYYWYRWHLVRGLASCTFWWASAHDFSKVFGPYAWNPDYVERGLGDLVRSIRSLDAPDSKKYKLKAEKLRLQAEEALWKEHWRRHWPPIPAVKI